MGQQPEAYTVAAITRMIKDTLESGFIGIWVEGEVSNYTHHSSGHRYFSLKDENAVLRAVMWRSVGIRLKFEPEPGQKVLAFGDIGVYEKGGQYQLICRQLVPLGTGALELAFRQLHERLAAEGLFDEERKRPIPQFAQRIGVVSSPTGAAIRDIIQIARRRNPSVQLVIYPAQVQGDGAENSVAAGIRYFNRSADVDLLIVGRGGGSLEDLWPFNTEVTVRAIVASRLPVISAVGHEIDVTLSDLAADLRAPTPSAAAELAVWSRREFCELLRSQLRQQADQVRSSVVSAREQLSGLTSRPVWARPLDPVQQRQQHLDSLMRLFSAAGNNNLASYRNRLRLSLSRLDALSPLRILARGYSVSRRLPQKVLLKSIGDIYPTDRMETILSDGYIISYVEKIVEKRQNATGEEI